MAKVLMLDDDQEALAWMSAALVGRGHDVRTFSSSRAALEALEAYAPDLLLSDILMPEIDGIAFARLARRHRSVPILFVSIAKKQAEAVIAGAAGYVQKPATAAEIRAAVERILGEGARKSTILTVDDDQDVLDLYAAFLEPRFEMVGAHDGREALAVLRARHVDLAIVDVHMPIMNGAELVRAIRADPALEALPVIVQTSDTNALHAPVWGSLRVSKVMDKRSFVDWFDAQVRAGPLAEAASRHP
jgi:CheY-like chemotaxis protein